MSDDKNTIRTSEYDSRLQTVFMDGRWVDLYGGVIWQLHPDGSETEVKANG